MKFNIDAEEFVLDSKKPEAKPSTKQPATKEEPKTERPKTIVEKTATTKKEAEKTEEKPNASDSTETTNTAEKQNEKPTPIPPKKNPGGRPKKEITRKQYTLTLREEDYKKAMAQAAEEDISFAKLVEKALKQYLS